MSIAIIENSVGTPQKPNRAAVWCTYRFEIITLSPFVFTLAASPSQPVPISWWMERKMFTIHMLLINIIHFNTAKKVDSRHSHHKPVYYLKFVSLIYYSMLYLKILTGLGKWLSIAHCKLDDQRDSIVEGENQPQWFLSDHHTCAWHTYIHR